MNNLKIFTSMEEFETAKPSMDTPFVVLEKGTSKVIYSNLLEITEEELPEGVVDLGLSVNWASCNIGANSPCESGLLFQFGRVDGYAYGDTSNQFRTSEQNTADTGSQYIPATTSGTVYKVGEVLKSADDAASVATNGAMRMPTAAEIDELLANTKNQWCQCTVLGADHTGHTIYGRLFTSNKDESKKIFIPAAGYFDGNGSFGYGGSFGCVWSSSVRTDFVNGGYYLFFTSSDCNRYDDYRFHGFSVRGVCSK